MIDEAQRLFDVALPIARFRIIFANQTTQRGTDLLVRGGLRNSQSFVKRCFHGRDRGKTQRKLTLEYSGNWPAIASRVRCAAHNVREAGAARHTLPLYVTASGKKAA